MLVTLPVVSLTLLAAVVHFHTDTRQFNILRLLATPARGLVIIFFDFIHVSRRLLF